MTLECSSNTLWPRLARLFALALALVMSTAVTADAKGKKRPAKAKKAPVNEEALAALRGPFEFGMDRKQILKILRTQIQEKYAEKISATTDVYTQDNLRRKQNAEIDRIKKSFVRFDGKKSNWEGSIIGDQFEHKTGESMMMFWETDAETGQDQRRFFFFHDDKLYKMFIALNSDTLKDEQRNFDFLKQIMEARFGPGEVTTVKERGEAPRPYAVHWQTKTYEAWAIDNMDVYGSFCLVVADRPTVAAVAEKRASLPKKDQRVRLIDGVIEKDEGPGLEAGNSDVVDRLTK